jgi:hypothetical protein
MRKEKDQEKTEGAEEKTDDGVRNRGCEKQRKRQRV